MADTPLLMVQDLRKVFPAGRTGLWEKKDRFVHALDGVSFNLEKGDVLALVGESGCGKSTLALTLIGLEHPTGGQILMEGKDITHLNPSDLKKLRSNIQMVFQDPYESLNPLMTVRQIVAEPLGVHNLARPRIEREQRVRRALEDAGLKPAEIYLDRLPHELSGGQRQRVVIAAALVLEPRILLADEPVSMLDVSIRAEILNLLIELRQSRGISVLFITHDLATAAYLAERVAVMYLGRIVEIGPIREVLAHPAHPYTKALLSVIPIPNPRARRERVILQGAPPNPIDVPSGCRFHPRCPVAIERCAQVDPALEVVSGEHQAACILLESPSAEKSL